MNNYVAEHSDHVRLPKLYELRRSLHKLLVSMREIKPLTEEEIMSGAGKFMPGPSSQKKVENLIEEGATTPESLVLNEIVPKNLQPSIFVKYPEMLAGIREYLNSGLAEKNPEIPTPTLRELQKKFELPGLIAKAQLSLSDAQSFASSTEDVGYFELLDELKNSLFQLEKKLDSGVKRTTFDVKTAESGLDDLAALLQNIQKELVDADSKKIRDRLRRYVGQLFGFSPDLPSPSARTT